MEVNDVFSLPRTIAAVLSATSLSLIAVTAIFRNHVISHRRSRFLWLKGAWTAYGVCALASLWLYLAIAGARAHGHTDIYAPSIRWPGVVLICAFLVGTITMAALLPGIPLAPASEPRERPSGLLLGAPRPAPPSAPVEVFLCAGEADATLRGELERHLQPLVDAGYVRLWHRGRLTAGGDMERETNDRIDRASVMLALTTPNLFDSEDVKAEIARARARGAAIIPVLARPFLWRLTELGSSQPLPRNGTPIEEWEDRDAGWLEVARGVLDVVTSPRAGSPGSGRI